MALRARNEWLTAQRIALGTEWSAPLSQGDRSTFITFKPLCPAMTRVEASRELANRRPGSSCRIPSCEPRRYDMRIFPFKRGGRRENVYRMDREPSFVGRFAYHFVTLFDSTTGSAIYYLAVGYFVVVGLFGTKPGDGTAHLSDPPVVQSLPDDPSVNPFTDPPSWIGWLWAGCGVLIASVVAARRAERDLLAAAAPRVHIRVTSPPMWPPTIPDELYVQFFGDFLDPDVDPSALAMWCLLRVELSLLSDKPASLSVRGSSTASDDNTPFHRAKWLRYSGAVPLGGVLGFPPDVDWDKEENCLYTRISLNAQNPEHIVHALIYRPAKSGVAVLPTMHLLIDQHQSPANHLLVRCPGEGDL
jgi:hypothetical protein